MYSFTEQEIWYVILGMAEVLYYLQGHREEVNDVHPSRILLDDRKEFKIVAILIVKIDGKAPDQWRPTQLPPSTNGS